MSPRLLRPVASGFDPRRLAGLVQWYDAADQSTMTLNGSTVSEWRSKVGGVAVSQGTAANQPTLTQNYYNGKSALTFDGGDFLYNASLPVQINGLSVGAIFDETARSESKGIFVASPSSGSDFAQAAAFALYLHAGTDRPCETIGDAGRIECRTPPINNTLATGKRVATTTVAPSIGGVGSAVLRYDGAQGLFDTSYDAPPQSTGTLIGGRYILGQVWPDQRLNGKMLEICVWNRPLTLSECRSFEKYANQKWGTAAT
jgi:hypothetical protein